PTTSPRGSSAARARTSTASCMLRACRSRAATRPLPPAVLRSHPRSFSAAACFSACALYLSRGRGLTARLVITVVAAALAVMVATSRVLLGVHWASDAFAGLCFGALGLGLG